MAWGAKILWVLVVSAVLDRAVFAVDPADRCRLSDLDAEKFASARAFPAGQYLLRSHATDKGAVHEVLDIQESRAEGLISRSYQRKVQNYQDASIKPAPSTDSNWHLSQAEEIARFATGQYRERREDWPETFIHKIEAGVKTYLNDSTFFEVRDEKTGDIVGSMRLVVAPYALKNGMKVPEGAAVRHYYGREATCFRQPGEIQPGAELPVPTLLLPAAEYLGIQMPPRVWQPKDGEPAVGVDIEVGLYAIDHRLSPKRRAQVKAELWARLLLFAYDHPNDMFNYYAKSFHEYADEASGGVYGPLGFEPLSGYIHSGKKVEIAPGQKPPTIPRDGKNWVPQVMYPWGLDRSHQKLADQTGRASVPDLKTPLLKPAPWGEKGPEVIPHWRALFEQLGSQDIGISVTAEATLIRLLDLHEEHGRVLQKSAQDASRAKESRESFESLSPIVREIQARLAESMKSDNAFLRERVVALADSIPYAFRDRHSFSRGQLLREVFIPGLADREWKVAIQTMYGLRNNYKPKEILEFLNPIAATPQFQPRALRAQKVEFLKRNGLSDEMIRDIARATKDALTKDTREVVSRNADGSVAVYIDRNWPIDAGGAAYFRNSQSRTDISEALIIISVIDILY